MAKIPVISGRECVRALEKIGFAIDRQRGSHIIMRREIPPPTRTVVVPNHREIDRGTLKGIIKQAGSTVDEFSALLND